MLNKVSIGVVSQMIEAIVTPAFQNGTIPQNIMIHGSPGLGKSANVKAAAEKISKAIGKPVEVIDVRLGTMESSEVQGIPYNAESNEYDLIEIPNGQTIPRFKKTMMTSTPEWFPTDPSKFYILFLDELTNASVAVQQAAYRIVLDRSITNGATLPMSCAIIGAGNLREDKTGAKPMVSAMANRFGVHLLVDAKQCADDIISFALKNQWHRSLVGFLTYKKEAIYVNSGSEDAFATPRTWEYVNNHLNNPMLANSPNLLDIAIAGAIGNATATEFSGFREYEGKLPDWEKICSGKLTYKLPEGDEALKFAVTVSLGFEMARAIVTEKDSEKNVKNLLKVAEQLPDEMCPVLIRTISGIDPEATRQIPHREELKGWYNKITEVVQKLRKNS